MFSADLRSLLVELEARMTSFAAIHACLFDREWLATRVHPMNYSGYVSALTEISVALERLHNEAARMAAEPESLTTFRSYFGALLPFLDASRDCVSGLRAYCVVMDSLARGSGGSIAEAERAKDRYVTLGMRMNSARNACHAASARWGLWV